MTDSTIPVVIKRRQAKALGLKKYYTGKLCPKGHRDYKFVSSKGCVSCQAKYFKKYQSENREKFNDWENEYYKRNKEAILERKRKSDIENSISKKAIRRNYLNKNRCRENGKRRQRYKNNINYRICCLLRSRLFDAVRHRFKKGSAIKLLGCSIPELIKYFETLFQPGMSWANHGEWHIDHKHPLSKFNLEDSEQLSKACHYTNLQPLWAVDNIIKKDKILS